MMRLLLLTLGFALGGVAAPASAQRQAPEAKARLAAEQYAACLVNKRGYRIRTELEAPFDSWSSKQHYSVLLDPMCLDDVLRMGVAQPELRFSALVIRGIVYDHLFALDFGKAAPIGSFEGFAAPVYPFGTDLPDRPGFVQKYRVAMAFGECVVRAAPLVARALILTRVASPEEGTAIAALKPSLGACVDAGSSLELSRSMIRGAVAEPLHRLYSRKAG